MTGQELVAQNGPWVTGYVRVTSGLVSSFTAVTIDPAPADLIILVPLMAVLIYLVTIPSCSRGSRRNQRNRRGLEAAPAALTLPMDLNYPGIDVGIWDAQRARGLVRAQKSHI